jgi:ferredoxin--NADP+ reductase
VVANEDGRIVGDEGDATGEYVAGWLKRGPVGVIGTNKGDAAETVRAVIADQQQPDAHRADSREPIEVLLEERGVQAVTYDGWLAIDAEEILRGSADGRKRVKVTDWATLRTLGGGA